MIKDLKVRFCLVDKELSNNDVRGLVIRRLIFGKKLIDRVNILDKSFSFEDRILMASSMLSKENNDYNINVDYTHDKQMIIIENCTHSY